MAKLKSSEIQESLVKMKINFAQESNDIKQFLTLELQKENPQEDTIKGVDLQRFAQIEARYHGKLPDVHAIFKKLEINGGDDIGENDLKVTKALNNT